MSTGSNDIEAQFRHVMTDAARQMLRGDERPYTVGMRLMGNLISVLDSDYYGAATVMWGGLTDGIDGPPRYARGLSEPEIEHLMRLAARDWLDLDLRPEALRQYFARWEDWPDSLGEPQQ